MSTLPLFLGLKKTPGVGGVLSPTKNLGYDFNMAKKFTKSIVKAVAPNIIIELYDLYSRTRGTHIANCPICGFRGVFKNFGYPPRINALCPRCNSLERHRLFFYFLLKDNVPNQIYLKSKVLHFAAEPILEEFLRTFFGPNYVTADLALKSDLQLDIENLKIDSDSVGTVICMHVLEHVNDEKALSELFRILEKGSFLILAFPIIEGWDRTYENPEIRSERERLIHFGQVDHIKYYGKDVRVRIEKHGFQIVEEIMASPELCVEYNLLRGEKIFICKKPA
jgi:hypothetical protein